MDTIPDEQEEVGGRNNETYEEITEEEFEEILEDVLPEEITKEEYEEILKRS